VLYINLLFRPLRTLADKFNTLQMGMVACERIFKVLDHDATIPDTGTYAPAHVKGEIQFDHVWFSYDGEEYVLKDISFRVNPGETLAIVGHTGSGKTSLISVLNRLYDIQRGRILIDGVDIRSYQLKALRSRIGVVLQDVFCFPDQFTTILPCTTGRFPWNGWSRLPGSLACTILLCASRADIIIG